jgi:biopolymer transport protein ExbB
VFAIIEAAGWPIWPLLLASVIAVALIIERLIVLRGEKIVPRALLPRSESKSRITAACRRE